MYDDPAFIDDWKIDEPGAGQTLLTQLFESELPTFRKFYGLFSGKKGLDCLAKILCEYELQDESLDILKKAVTEPSASHVYSNDASTKKFHMSITAKHWPDIKKRFVKCVQTLDDKIMKHQVKHLIKHSEASVDVQSNLKRLSTKELLIIYDERMKKLISLGDSAAKKMVCFNALIYLIAPSLIYVLLIAL